MSPFMEKASQGESGNLDETESILFEALDILDDELLLFNEEVASVPSTYPLDLRNALTIRVDSLAGTVFSVGAAALEGLYRKSSMRTALHLLHQCLYLGLLAIAIRNPILGVLTAVAFAPAWLTQVRSHYQAEELRALHLLTKAEKIMELLTRGRRRTQEELASFRRAATANKEVD